MKRTLTHILILACFAAVLVLFVAETHSATVERVFEDGSALLRDGRVLDAETGELRDPLFSR